MPPLTPEQRARLYSLVALKGNEEGFLSEFDINECARYARAFGDDGNYRPEYDRQTGIEMLRRYQGLNLYDQQAVAFAKRRIDELRADIRLEMAGGATPPPVGPTGVDDVARADALAAQREIAEHEVSETAHPDIREEVAAAVAGEMADLTAYTRRTLFDQHVDNDTDAHGIDGLATDKELADGLATKADTAHKHSYNDLTDRPDPPDLSSYATLAAVSNSLIGATISGGVITATRRNGQKITLTVGTGGETVADGVVQSGRIVGNNIRLTISTGGTVDVDISSLATDAEVAAAISSLATDADLTTEINARTTADTALGNRVTSHVGAAGGIHHAHPHAPQAHTHPSASEFVSQLTVHPAGVPDLATLLKTPLAITFGEYIAAPEATRRLAFFVVAPDGTTYDEVGRVNWDWRNRGTTRGKVLTLPLVKQADLDAVGVRGTDPGIAFAFSFLDAANQVIGDHYEVPFTIGLGAQYTIPTSDGGGGGDVTTAQLAAERALREAGDEWNKTIIGGSDAATANARLATFLAAQLNSDNSAVIEITADSAQSGGHSYVRGDLVVFPPRSNAGKIMGNVANAALAGFGFLSTQVKNVAELNAVADGQADDPHGEFVEVTAAFRYTPQGIDYKAGDVLWLVPYMASRLGVRKLFNLGDSITPEQAKQIGDNKAAVAAINALLDDQARQIGLMDIDPEPPGIAYTTGGLAAALTRTVRLRITNPEILTGDAWVEGLIDGQRVLGRRKWTNATGSLPFVISEAVARQIGQSEALTVQLDFYNVAVGSGQGAVIKSVQREINLTALPVVPAAPTLASLGVPIRTVTKVADEAAYTALAAKNANTLYWWP